MDDKEKFLDNILEHNPELESIVVVGTDDYNHVDASEHDHYMILPDPMADSDQRQDAWTMLLLKDPYKDFLVRVSDIIMEGQDLQYDWEPLSIPEDADEPEDHTDFLNYLTGCITDHVQECIEEGAAILRDEEGKIIEQ